MPRQKAYEEKEVLDRAMQVFWKNGFTNTSTRDLQREMKINLFSIYSSFESKEQLYLSSLKAYKKLNRELLLTPLMAGNSSSDIRDYFVKFLEFTRENESYRGCLLINSTQDLGVEITSEIENLVGGFAKEIIKIFTSILSNELESDAMISKKANYYFTSLVGLITTARALTQQQVDDYLEITFST